MKFMFICAMNHCRIGICLCILRIIREPIQYNIITIRLQCTYYTVDTLLVLARQRKGT